MAAAVAVCTFRWGSHKCGLEANVPHTIHRCQADGALAACCEYNEKAAASERVRWFDSYTGRPGLWAGYTKGSWT